MLSVMRSSTDAGHRGQGAKGVEEGHRNRRHNDSWQGSRFSDSDNIAWLRDWARSWLVERKLPQPAIHRKAGWHSERTDWNDAELCQNSSSEKTQMFFLCKCYLDSSAGKSFQDSMAVWSRLEVLNSFWTKFRRYRQTLLLASFKNNTQKNSILVWQCEIAL